jgi:hypothetical protein
VARLLGIPGTDDSFDDPEAEEAVDLPEHGDGVGVLR